MAEPLQKTREELKFKLTDDDDSSTQSGGSHNADTGVCSTPLHESNQQDAHRSEPNIVSGTLAAPQSSSTCATAQQPSEQFASSTASPQPTTSSAYQAQSATPSPSNDPDDLMDIITNPHASEADWVSACHQLDKHEQKKARNQKKQPISKRAIGIISALALGATIGASAIFHWGPFAQPQINYGPYMTTVQREIKHHWHPPKSTQESTVAIHFKVHKNGELTDVGFDRMSRLSEVDAAALKSVIESMPALPPLPEGAPESVDVQFHFDYNVRPKDKAKTPADKP